MRSIPDTNPTSYIQIARGPWAGDLATATLIHRGPTGKGPRVHDMIAKNASVAHLRANMKAEFPDMLVYG